MNWNVKYCVSCACQLYELFLKTEMWCNDIFYYLWTLPSVNMIETTGNGNCQGNLTKKPYKTYYSTGNKNELRRHILQTWVLFGETWWCLTFPETYQEGVILRSCLKLQILIWSNLAVFFSQSVTWCLSTPNRLFHDWLLRWA